jgi:hypothetical protein
MEVLQRVIGSSKATNATRQDNGSAVEPIGIPVLASEAGVHHKEDDLDPDEEREQKELRVINLTLHALLLINLTLHALLLPKICLQ